MNYLLERKNTYKQYRETRRNGATNSGVVVLHTAEGGTSFAGADTKAEAVANFIATRSDAGSYHVLCDSDSTIQLAPWHYETWHETTVNNHAVGISAAINSADWKKLGSRGDAIVARMAASARAYAAWLKATRGVTIPARRLTRAEAVARVPGFICHGDIDTGRRTDPGRDFPWDLFFNLYNNGAGTPTVTQEDKMLILAMDKKTGMVWIGDGITRRHVPNEVTLKDIQYKISNEGLLKGSATVLKVDSLDWLGTPVPFDVKATVTVDSTAISSAIVKALEGKVATADNVTSAVKDAFRRAGS